MTHADGARTAATARVEAPELLEHYRRGGLPHRPSDQFRSALLAEPAPVGLQPL